MVLEAAGVTLAQALKRIEDLERRVKELEARPPEQHTHYHAAPIYQQPALPYAPAPLPWNPLIPYCVNVGAAHA